MGICDINNMRGRGEFDTEYSQLARRFKRLQIAPKNLWVGSVNVLPYTNLATLGRKQLALPDGALMIKLTSVPPFTTGVGELFWGFSDGVAQVTGNNLSGLANQLYANDCRYPAGKNNINSGWFYCRGRREFYLFNGMVGARRVGIEIYIGDS